MKKIIFLTFLILGTLAYGQADPEFRSVSFSVDDASEMNSIPSGKLSNGKTVYRRDTKTIWIYDVNTWKDTGVGPGGIGGIDASGFDGVLNSTDDTTQEIAQALDDLDDTEIQSSFAPTNYTPASSTIRGQFQGINTALASVQVGADVVKVDPEDTQGPIVLAEGDTPFLDGLSDPPSGTRRLEFANDDAGGNPGTDGYITSVTVTGLDPKTWTFKRNGLPDIVVQVADNGTGGAVDGNDFVEGLSLVGTVLTLEIPNQPDPTIDLSVIQDGVGDGSETFISAGANVTVSGTGTSADPYIINSSASGGGVSDHGLLTGLLDDDHPQYQTQAESDARYLQAEVDGSVTNEIQTLSKSGTTVTLSNGGGSFTDADTQLSNEQVSDYVGAMVSGNTETGITVTYQDGDNTIDFVAADTSPTNEIQTLSKSGTTVTLSNGGGSFTDADTQLTDEEVQDKVGAMVSGNAENNITVTYNDTTGKLDFDISASVIGQTSGSWTPTLGGTYTSYTARGYWVKLGNRATIWIEITGVNSTVSQSISINNLPPQILARVDGTFSFQQSSANVRVTGNASSSFNNALAVFPQNTQLINITSKDPAEDVFGTFSSGTIQITATYITN